MFQQLITVFSTWLMPIFLLIVFAHAFIKKIDIFAAFVEGAKDSFSLILRLMPYIVGIYVAIGIFRSSGALELLAKLLQPILSLAKIPQEVLPLFIVRPLSGPAALGVTADLINTYGADSFIGRLAATIDGSTDTTIYILAIYFASVGIKKARYSLPVGLLADIMGFFAAVYICYRFFT
ncbi:MAG: nucleoside recognition domain-containing protein [Bacillota bacterium]